MKKFKWIVGLLAALVLFSKFFGEIIQKASEKPSDTKYQSKVKNELKKELEEEESNKTDKYENTNNLSTEKVQNFDAVLPCESQVKYVTHEHIWRDFNNKRRKAKVTILPSVACEAEEFREKLPEPVSDGSVKDYYGKVYIQLAKNNRNKMKEVYKSFAKIKKKYNLGYREFAEMAVSYVQSVPYVLVHPESCLKARQWGGFFKEYHDEGKECLPEIRFGLTAPSEFIYNLKGDCDTRVVFLYTLLSHFGYDVAVFVSRTHCMLGINLPAQGDYLKYKNKKYYFWETTAEGFYVGIIPPNFKQDVWDIALVKPAKKY